MLGFSPRFLWNNVRMWQYPLGPLTHQLLRAISLLGRWSTSDSDRGIAHFFIATRNTIKGVGGKRTNEQNTWVNSRCKRGSYVTLHSLVHMYTNASVDFLRNFYKATRNANLFWPVFTRWSRPSLMLIDLSAVRCRLATRVTLCQLPSSGFLLSHSLTGVPFLLPVTSRSRVQTLFLVSCQNRQRDCLLGGPPT